MSIPSSFKSLLPEYDEELAKKAREEAFREKKNSALRYDPFALLNADSSAITAAVNQSKARPDLNQLLSGVHTKSVAPDDGTGRRKSES